MPLEQQEKLVERFFRPRGTAPSVQEDGFLPDMDSTYAKFACVETVRIAEVFASRCVVLLGEPGIGKSIVMDQRRDALPADAVAHDLRWVPPEKVLAGPEIAAWRQNQRDLHLVIDSIDESTDTSFARMLVGALRGGPASRLKLELACRGAEWPPVLEEQLPRLFGEDQVKYFQIEPLQRKDVVAIAEARSVDANAFLDAVWRSGIGALASVPMTLRMLLDVFEVERALPQSQSDIYEKACLELCRERSTSRLPAAKEVDPHARLDRASELAAVSILCRRNRLVESSVALLTGDLPVIELPRALPALTAGVVADALKSGLFSTKGPGTWGWFHQSLPEYLAARWISRSTVSDVQLRQILVDEADGVALVPQLKGLAAWLACLDARVVRLLAEINPELLLSVSSSLVTDADRAIAASRHFERLATLEATDWLNRNECLRLNHPGLAEQIASYLCDKSANMLVRLRVLHIAGVIGLGILEDPVCAIALDPGEESATRVAAIDAAFEFPGDKATVVERLRHLAEPSLPDASDEQIRGAVIGHLWPNWLDSPTLFSLLTRPRKPGGSGRYHHVFYALEKSLRQADLVEALAWIERNARPGGPDDFYAGEQLATAACRLALQYVEEPEIRDGLAKVAIRVLKHASPLFGSARDPEHQIDTASRRERMKMLVPAMASTSEVPEDDGFRVVYPHGEPALVDPADIEWLLAGWRASADHAKAFFARAIVALQWKHGDPRVLDLVLEEVGDARESPLLSMPRWIELGSEGTTHAKKCFDAETKRQLEWAEQNRQRKEERERQRLTLFAAALAGDPADWATFVLHRQGDCKWGEVGLVEGVFVLSTLVEEQMSQLVTSASRYLSTRAAQVDKWPHYMVGYLSLRLLQATGAPRAKIAAHVREWAPAVLYWDTAYLYDEYDTEPHRELVRVAFDVSNDQARAALQVVLRRQLNREWPPAIFEYLPTDASAVDVLLEFLAVHRYFPKTRNLVAGLLQIQRERALAWARTELGASALTSTVSRRSRRTLSRSKVHGRGRGRFGQWGARAAIANHATRRTEIVAALAADGRSDSWRVAWDECERDPHVAARVLPNVVGRLERDTWGLGLTEQQTAAYYDWLESNVPIDGSTSDFSEDRMLRQRLLGRVSASGSAESVALVRELSEKHPDDVSVKVALPRVLDLKRERAWHPLALGEFEDLIVSPDRRLIRNDEQLLDVVVEALGVFQAMMHCETPAVGRFWNCWTENRTNIYSPKDEGNISDELAIFLREQLNKVVVGGTVVVNREVEIRSGDADLPGEEPDLLVQAMGKSEVGGPFQVAIEVKGSWNAGVETAIETQLRDRYLSDGKLRCGIYVVGWFACAKWDPQDESRQAACRRHTRDGLRERLDSSARALETDGRKLRATVLDLTMGKLARATGAIECH